jgi:glycosyltransferase involved in cell wall biosynthesis
MTYFTDRLERKALSMVDAIQVMNPWMLDYARQVNAERSTLIRYAPPGVDAELFRPTLNRDLRRDAYVLTVGRLDDPRKNIELVLNAYASLPDELQRSTRLVLAGSADPGSTFWKRVKDLMLGQRVEFIRSPDRETLVRLYQSAAVFALGSDEEGFGMVILEAMACGVPVVSTRSGGPQGIIADGHDGFLVPLADPNAMGDRLACLLSDEALNRRMGEAARETVMQKYEAGVAGDAFLRVYDELLSRDRSRAAVTL